MSQVAHAPMNRADPTSTRPNTDTQRFQDMWRSLATPGPAAKSLYCVIEESDAASVRQSARP
jgi:hypothetical protein